MPALPKVESGVTPVLCSWPFLHHFTPPTSLIMAGSWGGCHYCLDLRRSFIITCVLCMPLHRYRHHYGRKQRLVGGGNRMVNKNGPLSQSFCRFEHPALVSSWQYLTCLILVPAVLGYTLFRGRRVARSREDNMDIALFVPEILAWRMRG